MKHFMRFALTLFAFSLTSVAVAESWIHVKVDNQDNDELVTVNLPLSMVNAAVAMIPADVKAEGKISIDDHDFDWNELMTLWSEIKHAPEATFVTVQSRDENIAVKKQGDFLLVETTEVSDHGTEITAKIPLAVVDALLSGSEGSFDFAAAFTALADHGTGDIVTIQDGRESVRVWIDDRNKTD